MLLRIELFAGRGDERKVSLRWEGNCKGISLRLKLSCVDENGSTNVTSELMHMATKIVGEAMNFVSMTSFVKLRVDRRMTFRSLQRLMGKIHHPKSTKSGISHCFIGTRSLSAGEGPSRNQEKMDKAAKFVWSTSVIGTVAIFGGGLATGYETLFPAWAFFHSCGACASYIQRQPFEVFMHSAVMLGVLMYWGNEASTSKDRSSRETISNSIEKHT